MIRAFVFLIATSTRNKFASQLRRLRNPRYAIALLLGLGYFWLVFFNRSARDSRQAPPGEIFDTFALLLPLGVLFIALYMWLFVKDRTALAFTPAEVSLLFTAPVSRRALILYKLARGQAAVLSTSLIWVLLLNRGHRGLEHAIGYWLLLSTTSMHRLGIALVRTSPSEHGRVGLRRTWPALLVAAVALGSIAWGIGTHWVSFRNIAGADDLRAALASFAESRPMSWVLWPFKALIGPTFSRTTTTWLAALPAAFLLFAAHMLWVLQSDAAFEEAAIEASAQRARALATRRSRGASVQPLSTKARKRTIRLKPTGTPAVAILWKNYLWLSRTGQLRALVGLPLLTIALAIGFFGRNRFAEILVFAVCAGIGGMAIFLAPMTMRNDLRGELSRVATLKTFPLKGNHIMMAEVCSSALPTALMQYLLLIGAVISISSLKRQHVAPEIAWGIVLGAPLLVAAISIANFTIHNGLALTFPAWVKVGESGVSGLETMGQSMLIAIVTVVMLAILLIFPAVAGAVGYFTLRGAPVVGFVAAGGAAGILLGLECYGLMNMLGSQLDELEPMHVS